MEEVTTDDARVTLSSVSAADLASRYSGEGWDVAILSGRALSTKAALLEHFASHFSFPEHFGANWDAFHDCMSEVGSSAN
jgi:hypothetical protein